jgi:hypothetical protein
MQTSKGTILKKLEAISESCSFIVANHEARQEARAAEIDSLKKSIAVLAGAGGENFGATTTPAPGVEGDAALYAGNN